MQSLLAYLAASAEHPLPFAQIPPGLPPFPSRLQVYAALVGRNGGPRVTSWGKLSPGGIYGRQGLSSHEAFALIELTAFINGWLEATNGAEEEALRLAVEAEFARVKALRALGEIEAVTAQPPAAPDRVGDQRVTLERLRRWAPAVREMRALGAKVVLPIQQGALTPAAFDQAAVEVLGFNDAVRAIPSNKDAMPTAVLESYLRAVRPAAVHLLGCGPRNPRYVELVQLCARLVPQAKVSCDSNALAAHVGHTNGRDGGPRQVTAWASSFAEDGTPQEKIREAAIAMTFSPAVLFERAMAAYRQEGLMPSLRQRPLQQGLFDDVPPSEGDD